MIPLLKNKTENFKKKKTKPAFHSSENCVSERGNVARQQQLGSLRGPRKFPPGLQL